MPVATSEVATLCWDVNVKIIYCNNCICQCCSVCHNDKLSVVALVLSQLDYGNAMLVGLICRLQSVMNASARLIHRLRSSDHITDALVKLHWLFIQERIQFKVAFLVYKVLHGLASQYLGPLTHISNLPGWRALRSASTNQCLFDCRQSGMRRCWPANLEQSASSCDLSRDSYHVQTETQNISLLHCYLGHFKRLW